MENKKKSDFDKVLSGWDIMVIAFGAMIGWGWVVSTGGWIEAGGAFGAMLGFAIGGVMIFFVGLTYAELTPAMPRCGGEHVFSYRAMGPAGSFICTWAIVFGYVSVVCFEACAFPTVLGYIWPGFLKGYMYTIEGFDIYGTWVAVAVIAAALMTYVNIRGVKTAAVLQSVLTVIIGLAGIALFAVSLATGDIENFKAQAFVGETRGAILKTTLSVAMMTPFYFIGFDVIPQAAEEIKTGLAKIGKILILSIICAVIFYAMVIFAVGYELNPSELAQAMKGNGLVSADAFAKAFNSKTMADVIILGGLCGILTSWNSFLVGGSRALYSMAESYMVPAFLGKLHPKFKTPITALYLIGFLSMLAPFAGKSMLGWISNAGNFGCVLAYCMVALSFLMLRKKEPDMKRPYKVKCGKLVGVIAVILSGAMLLMYMIPGSGSTLGVQEWSLIGFWSLLGVVFFIVCKMKYAEKFGYMAEIISDEDALSLQVSNEELGTVLDQAIEEAISTVLKKQEVGSML
ncbi:MAG: APC family permease [Lachnospiraceae bacterium]|nr:APC family permease [Lachnospiraceae bacterium]